MIGPAALFRVKDWLRSGSDYSDGIPHPRLRRDRLRSPSRQDLPEVLCLPHGRIFREQVDQFRKTYSMYLITVLQCCADFHHDGIRFRLSRFKVQMSIDTVRLAAPILT